MNVDTLPSNCDNLILLSDFYIEPTQQTMKDICLNLITAKIWHPAITCSKLIIEIF